MAAWSLRTPSYQLHKPSGQAVIPLDGKDYYLGHHGSPESRAEFDRMVAEWLSNGRRLPAPASPSGSDLTFDTMQLAYLRHAEAYYVKNGEPTSEPTNIWPSRQPDRR